MFGIQMRRSGAQRVSPESIRHDDEKEVGKRDHQAEGEADGGFLAVSRDPERTAIKANATQASEAAKRL